MPILIDGWNFIRNRNSEIRDDAGSSLDSARALISYMNDFQATHNDPVIIVFDSKHEFLGIEYKNSAKLHITPVKDADDYIRKYIDNTSERQRKNVRVVSSDNSVYFYARSSGAAAMRSEEFWDKLYSGKERSRDKYV